MPAFPKKTQAYILAFLSEFQQNIILGLAYIAYIRIHKL